MSTSEALYCASDEIMIFSGVPVAVSRLRHGCALAWFGRSFKFPAEVTEVPLQLRCAPHGKMCLFATPLRR